MQCSLVAMAVFVVLEGIHHFSPVLAFGIAIGGMLTAAACLLGLCTTTRAETNQREDARG